MKFRNLKIQRLLPHMISCLKLSLLQKFLAARYRQGRIDALTLKWRPLILSSIFALGVVFTPNIASSTTREAGGKGGARFDLACKPGEVLVGVRGKAGTFIDRLSLWCVKVNRSGKWVGKPAKRGSPAGGTRGKRFFQICPKNSAVTGFKGKHGKYVDNLQIQCKPLIGKSKTSGKAIYRKAVGGGLLAKKFGPFSCPGRRPAYGAFGKSGIYINRLGLKCQDEHEWKPKFHFSPKQGWMNDPAGLVFDNGVYHLYYQAVPNQPTFDQDKMRWGHAISTNLIKWRPPKGLIHVFNKSTKDGAPFTGSAIAVKKTHRLCQQCKTQPKGSCIVAFFTRAKGFTQKQVVAPSCDGGFSYHNQGKTVLENKPRNPTQVHFRDPKLFWYQPPKRSTKGYWVMVLAVGDRVELYKSTESDLGKKKWRKLSELKIYSRYNLLGPFVETPDLFEVPVKNGGGSRWVLLYAEGYIPAGVCRQFLPGILTLVGNTCNKLARRPSSSLYLVGHFNGTKFQPEGARKGQSLRKTSRLLDAGPDFYAPQTWSNAPKRIVGGWQNNWLYAHELPTTRWRGSLAIPRELSLSKIGRRHVLIQNPVGISTQRRTAKRVRIPKSTFTAPPLRTVTKVIRGFRAKAFEANITFDVGSAKEVGVHIRAGGKGKTVVKWSRLNTKTKAGFVSLDRRSGWGAGGSPPSGFARSYSAPLVVSNNQLKLRILVDRNSVEVFAGKGEVVLTGLIFPDITNTQFKVYASGGKATVVKGDLYPME